MSYGRFAYLYDTLMSDVPYERWIAYMDRFISQKNTKVLDLACGTGTITEKLLEKGYDVTGVDLSEEMLAVAAEKLSRRGYNIPLFTQDMAELAIDETFDAVTIFCDSLNYVVDENDVKETFARVYHHLNEGGLFFFDVHSLFKIHEIFIDKTFTVDEEEIALIWNCFAGETPNTVEHEMTFFVQDEQEDYYHRFDEIHIQRTFSTETYEQWLEEVGFQVISITSDYGDSEVEKDSERIFFVARKASL